VYGVQWRHWRTPQHVKAGSFKNECGSYFSVQGGIQEVETDQLRQLIDGIIRNPHGRRHILSAWNPGELSQMALPPCHVLAQFYVSKDNRLSCQMYQRSCDMFLGVPFNIASYSILTAMIAQVCGLAPGEFVHVLGDAHIYLNHVEQVKEQLEREPLPAPTLWLNPDIKDITQFTMADIRLDGYQSHTAIKAEMAV
jgi:thymidylate synthase